MSCKYEDSCVNAPEQCALCNGDFYYSPIKVKARKFKKSKRQGSYLEEEVLTFQPNSGATPFKKGDCIRSNFLIECKSTRCKNKPQKSISIKEEDLQNIIQYAKEEDKVPVLTFSMGGEGSQIYAIIKYEDLLNLWKNLT